jgi:hypothetical protein
LHARTEANPFPTPHLQTADDRQWTVAEPTEQSDHVRRHAGGSQAGQAFKAALQRQAADPDRGQFSFERAAAQDAITIVPASY